MRAKTRDSEACPMVSTGVASANYVDDSAAAIFVGLLQ